MTSTQQTSPPRASLARIYGLMACMLSALVLLGAWSAMATMLYWQ